LGKEGHEQEKQKLHDFLVRGKKHNPKKMLYYLSLIIPFLNFLVYSTYVFVFSLLGEILGGILSALLVWGAVKKRRNFLLPWLIFAAIVMVGTVICLITFVVLLPVSYGITFLVIGILELRKQKFNLIIANYFHFINL